MFRLYWKIFLGFWLTGLVLGAIIITVNQQLTYNKNSELAGLEPREIANRTTFILRHLPAEALNWQQALADSGIELYIRSEQKTSVAERNTPINIETIFKALKKENRSVVYGLTKISWGERVESVNGQSLRYVLAMPGLSVFRIRQLAEQITMQFSLAMIISGLACLILARYLTRNLKKISVAAQKLAEGDLNTRIQVKKHLTNDELDALGNDFNRMAEALELSMKQQQQLVRDISHELRSPLARLQLALELARKDNTEEQLNRIGHEADRLNDMIGQLLAMPEKNLQLEDCVDIGELLISITQESTIEADQKEVEFNLNIEQNLLANAHTSDLHSALENIVRNAIRYTQTQSTIGIIACSKNNNQDQLEIIVSDQGPGIPDENLDQIFEPFYRVDPARNRKTGGYGIGLAIVKRVITAHGGEVKASNRIDTQGLSVRITLPRYTTN